MLPVSALLLLVFLDLKVKLREVCPAETRGLLRLVLEIKCSVTVCVRVLVRVMSANMLSICLLSWMLRKQSWEANLWRLKRSSSSHSMCFFLCVG